MKGNNIITITGGTFRDTKKALSQWIDLYFDESDSHLAFELYKNGRSGFVIIADKGLDNESFFYLVNYLQSPKDIEYNVEIEGFTTGDSRSEIYLKKILVYVSPKDTEGDNVFAVTSENKHYKLDFSGKTVSIQDDRTYKSAPKFDGLEEGIILAPGQRREPPGRKGIFKKNTPENRFKIISLVITGLFLASPLLTLYNFETFQKFLFMIGVATGGWFWADYKMLRSNRLYFGCLGLALVFLVYELFLNYIFPDERGFILLGMLIPITLLLIQRPLRFIYLLILEEDPKTETAGSIPDAIYSFILIFGILILPFLIMDYLNSWLNI